MNKHLQTVGVAPMTSSSKQYPTRVKVHDKTTKELIATDQIRTIDRIRIVKYFEALTEREFEKVKSVVQETFVD